MGKRHLWISFVRWSRLGSTLPTRFIIIYAMLSWLGVSPGAFTQEFLCVTQPLLHAVWSELAFGSQDHRKSSLCSSCIETVRLILVHEDLYAESPMWFCLSLLTWWELIWFSLCLRIHSLNPLETFFSMLTYRVAFLIVVTSVSWVSKLFALFCKKKKVLVLQTSVWCWGPALPSFLW